MVFRLVYVSLAASKLLEMDNYLLMVLLSNLASSVRPWTTCCFAFISTFDFLLHEDVSVSSVKLLFSSISHTLWFSLMSYVHQLCSGVTYMIVYQVLWGWCFVFHRPVEHLVSAMNGCMDEGMNGGMSKWRMDGRMDGRWVDGWGGWMEGWVNGGWMGGWMGDE